MGRSRAELRSCILWQEARSGHTVAGRTEWAYCGGKHGMGILWREARSGHAAALTGAAADVDCWSGVAPQVCALNSALSEGGDAGLRCVARGGEPIARCEGVRGETVLRCWLHRVLSQCAPRWRGVAPLSGGSTRVYMVRCVQYRVDGYRLADGSRGARTSRGSRCTRDLREPSLGFVWGKLGRRASERGPRRHRQACCTRSSLSPAS